LETSEDDPPDRKTDRYRHISEIHIDRQEDNNKAADIFLDIISNFCQTLYHYQYTCGSVITLSPTPASSLMSAIDELNAYIEENYNKENEFSMAKATSQSNILELSSIVPSSNISKQSYLEECINKLKQAEIFRRHQRDKVRRIIGGERDVESIMADLEEEGPPPPPPVLSNRKFTSKLAAVDASRNVSHMLDLSSDLSIQSDSMSASSSMNFSTLEATHSTTKPPLSRSNLSQVKTDQNNKDHTKKEFLNEEVLLAHRNRRKQQNLSYLLGLDDVYDNEEFNTSTNG
jgi:hypothetical protein